MVGPIPSLWYSTFEDPLFLEYLNDHPSLLVMISSDTTCKDMCKAMFDEL